jgi:hypothetical protein
MEIKKSKIDKYVHMCAWKREKKSMPENDDSGFVEMLLFGSTFSSKILCICFFVNG